MSRGVKRAIAVLAAAGASLLVACPDKNDSDPSRTNGDGDATATTNATPVATAPLPPTSGAAGSARGATTRAASPALPTPRASNAALGDHPASSAMNGDDIARYDDEKRLPDVADHINWDMRVRSAPSVKDGDVIVALRSGTPVTKLAKRGQWFLVTFDDPKDKSRRLMGWTWEQAFFPLSGKGDETKLCACWKKEHAGEGCEAVAGIAMGECDRTYGDDCAKLIACVHGQLAPKCMPNERLVEPQGACAKACTRNADCPNDQLCTETLGDPHVCRPAKVLTE